MSCPNSAPEKDAFLVIEVSLRAALSVCQGCCSTDVLKKSPEQSCQCLFPRHAHAVGVLQLQLQLQLPAPGGRLSGGMDVLLLFSRACCGLWAITPHSVLSVPLRRCPLSLQPQDPAQHLAFKKVSNKLLLNKLMKNFILKIVIYAHRKNAIHTQHVSLPLRIHVCTVYVHPSPFHCADGSQLWSVLCFSFFFF